MMEEKKTAEESTPPTPLPTGQRRFDNYWLWLTLSFLICFLVYNLWGLLELWRLPELVP